MYLSDSKIWNLWLILDTSGLLKSSQNNLGKVDLGSSALAFRLKVYSLFSLVDEVGRHDFIEELKHNLLKNVSNWVIFFVTNTNSND